MQIVTHRYDGEGRCIREHILERGIDVQPVNIDGNNDYDQYSFDTTAQADIYTYIRPSDNKRLYIVERVVFTRPDVETRETWVVDTAPDAHMISDMLKRSHDKRNIAFLSQALTCKMSERRSEDKGLPVLRGTPTQIAWASAVRRQMTDTSDAWLAALPEDKRRDAEFAVAITLADVSAAYWINVLSRLTWDDILRRWDGN